MEVSTGRYDDLLRRLLAIKGRPVAPVIGPELLPALVLESDRPEWKILTGTRPFAQHNTVSAAAGLQSFYQLFNPVDSGTLAVVTALSSFTTTVLTLRTSSAAKGTPSNGGQILDTRGIGAQTWALSRPTVDLNTGTQAAPGAGEDTIEVVASDPAPQRGRFFTCPPIVLSPGFGVYVHASTLEAVEATWVWYERAIEATER